MRWWGAIWSLGSNWSQEARCINNLLNHGLGACPMTLLVKDHKSWSLVPKTRSVMGGNVGGNAGISEFISLILEHVAREQDGNMEISATNGLLADITDLNDDLEVERRTEEFSIREEDTISPQEEISSREEGMSTPVRKPEVQAQPVPQVTTQQEELDVQSTTPPPGIHTAGGEQTEEPFDKMRMSRNKMVEARRLADKELHRCYKDKTAPMKRLGEEEVVYARDVDNKQLQDHD